MTVSISIQYARVRRSMISCRLAPACSERMPAVAFGAVVMRSSFRRGTVNRSRRGGRPRPRLGELCAGRQRAGLALGAEPGEAPLGRLEPFVVALLEAPPQAGSEAGAGRLVAVGRELAER